ncbi:hypothetical protein C9374_006892 [Naegleria lovaniensis]|uniref:Cleavage stimulation factor 50 kDa subunit n=1 Tax=Naegleria lovaniensis TaxID=51637 RepID=A0AA88H3W0_NAELO|nr:uncharacterized protein C9374_006892 [Naegleria lovaniensis]KAG2393361.1 hypothetical protein C9374_006892 [Naegleria lovaniensis]
MNPQATQGSSSSAGGGASSSQTSLPNTIANNAGNTISCGDLLTSFFNQNHHQQNMKAGASAKQQQQYVQQLIQEDLDDFQNPNSKMFKKFLYQMVVNQLKHDGFQGAANAVSEALFLDQDINLYEKSPHRLSELVLLGLEAEKELKLDLFVDPFPGSTKKSSKKRKGDFASQQGHLLTLGENFYKTTIPEGTSTQSKSSGLSPDGLALKNCTFTTKFITTHKGAARCAKFSNDGRYVVTGSADCSLKLLDVTRMNYHHQTKAEVEDYSNAKPVIRTFYDHQMDINDVEFHPVLPIIISASKDRTIKFFDITKPSVKRAFHTIDESHNVRTISMHPSGNYLLVGTEDSIIRTYDLTNNYKCYASSNSYDNHMGAINQVRYSSDGKMFISAGKDGSIKLWDGVIGRCVTTIPKAHGEAVFSVQFSQNSKYFLSGGSDAIIRLWDISTGKQVRTYEPPNPHELTSRVQTTFTYNESGVVSSFHNDIYMWDTRMTSISHHLSGHIKPVRWVATSPCMHAFMSCSEDLRARFWNGEP